MLKFTSFVFLCISTLSNAQTLDSTLLPIVGINTNFQAINDEPKIQAQFLMLDNGPGNYNHITDLNYVYDGPIGIEQRGSISQQWWWLQKSYGFETWDNAGLDSNVSLLGMPSESDWIFYGPFSEATLMKNALTYQLARELGYWAPRTRFCEMMLKTGLFWQYNGVYTMMEKIKRDNNRVDIAKLDLDDNAGDSITGGYIFAVDRNINTPDSGWFSPHPQSTNLFLSYKYPSGDEITLQQQAYIQNYVNDFENALSGPNFMDPLIGFRAYIQEQSFMDFFFLQEMSKNVDAYKRSSYLTKPKNNKLIAGPHWDYNSAWNVGIGGCETFDSDTGWTYQATCWVNSGFPVPFWWGRLLEDPVYAHDLNCRWQTLRQTTLSDSHIFHLIDSMYLLLEEPSIRHYQKFNISSTLLTEVTNLKTWIAARMAWLDTNMPSSCPDLSILENQKDWEIYPNPAQENLYISFDGNQIPETVDLFSISGAKIYSLKVVNNTVSIDHIIPGTYFIKAESFSTKRFVKN